MSLSPSWRSACLSLMVLVLLNACGGGSSGDNTAPAVPSGSTKTSHTIDELNAQTRRALKHHTVYAELMHPDSGTPSKSRIVLPYHFDYPTRQKICLDTVNPASHRIEVYRVGMTEPPLAVITNERNCQSVQFTAGDYDIVIQHGGGGGVDESAHVFAHSGFTPQRRIVRVRSIAAGPQRHECERCDPTAPDPERIGFAVQFRRDRGALRQEEPGLPADQRRRTVGRPVRTARHHGARPDRHLQQPPGSERAGRQHDGRCVRLRRPAQVQGIRRSVPEVVLWVRAVLGNRHRRRHRIPDPLGPRSPAPGLGQCRDRDPAQGRPALGGAGGEPGHLAPVRHPAGRGHLRLVSQRASKRHHGPDQVGQRQHHRGRPPTLPAKRPGPSARCLVHGRILGRQLPCQLPDRLLHAERIRPPAQPAGPVRAWWGGTPGRSRRPPRQPRASAIRPTRGAASCRWATPSRTPGSRTSSRTIRDCSSCRWSSLTTWVPPTARRSTTPTTSTRPAA